MAALDELLGESPAIASVREKILGILRRHGDARRLPPILLLGETGTGKGLLARAIHRASARASGPFIDVNCAAIPENLLEAEMFGFERGAFTDARQAKPGLFQAAGGGTIFLDEIGLLPESLQSKLLKVIEERIVRRLGSTRSEPIDVWIIAGTNEDLAAAARGARFREDLYHRLAVLTIELPPLRARGDDVVRLAEHFLARACADYSLPPKTLGADARRALATYPWPGNVRELGNVMERVALLGDGRLVSTSVLGLPDAAPPPGVSSAHAAEPTRAPATPGERGEREQLVEALRATAWNISRAAARLGITRNTIRYRIEKHRVSRERDGAADVVARDAPPALAAPPPARHAPAAAASDVTAPLPSGADDGPGVGTVRWERRRLTLVRAEVGATGTDEALQSARNLEIVVEKLATFGGRVEELGRTGVLAVFGLEPAEDAPRRAALAAMAMQRAVGRATTSGVRVAIHVDQCLVARVRRTSSIDQAAKRQASAVLDALLAQATADEIVVTDAAAAFLERRFELSPPAPGSSRRLVGHERAAGAGRHAPFVGRAHELELLRSRLEVAVAVQGEVIGIVGEPGIGKSRLLLEFRQTLGADRVAYLEGRCVSHGTAIPYLPVLDLVRAHCGVTEGDDAETIVARVRATLAIHGLGDGDGAAYLLHLLGVSEHGDGLAAMDADAVRERIFETLRQLWLRASHAKPIVVVVEDLHWIDRASEECLTALVDAIRGAAILFIATHRSGYQPPWIGRSYATQLALQPLAPTHSRRLVQATLDADVSAAVVDLILEKAEGNPFFLEELTLAVRGHTGPGLAVPDTVEEVLLSRIDRLPPDDKRVLQCAAVVGRTVSMDWLRALAPGTEDALARGLRQLQSAEFLYESGAGGDREYTFKHALTQEVAYGSLLAEERRALHTRLVDAIEARAGERVDDAVDALAHHAFQGGAWKRAARYCRQAGLRAASRSAHREAVARFEDALAALGHLPAGRDEVEQAIDVRFDLRNSLYPLGEFERILAHLHEVEPLAASLGDRARLGRVSLYTSQHFWWVGEPNRAVECVERALGMATEIDDLPLRITATYYLGVFHHTLGEYGRATEVLEAGVASLSGALVYERFGLPGVLSVFFRSWLTQCHLERGEFAEAAATGDEAIRLAAQANDPYSLAQACFSVGMLHLRRGAFEEAIPVLARGADVCRTWNIRIWAPRLASALGAAQARSGRVDEALALLERAIDDATAAKTVVRHIVSLIWLGEVYVAVGRTGDAAGVASHALALARQHDERGHEAWALRLAGDVAVADGALDEAERSYREALTLAEARVMRPLAARCHLALGVLYRRAGKHTDARPYLAGARAGFAAMAMRSWEAEADAELAALG